MGSQDVCLRSALYGFCSLPVACTLDIRVTQVGSALPSCLAGLWWLLSLTLSVPAVSDLQPWVGSPVLGQLLGIPVTLSLSWASSLDCRAA